MYRVSRLLGAGSILVAGTSAGPLTPAGAQDGSSVVRPAAGAIRENALKCDHDVCLYVEGRKLHVEFVKGEGEIRSFRCTTFDVYVDMKLVHQSPVACGGEQKDQYFEGSWKANRTFRDGARICGAFVGAEGHPSVAGLPCATIHS